MPINITVQPKPRLVYDIQCFTGRENLDCSFFVLGQLVVSVVTNVWEESAALNLYVGLAGEYVMSV